MSEGLANRSAGWENLRSIRAKEGSFYQERKAVRIETPTQKKGLTRSQQPQSFS
jgi:hypothetical protein